MFSVISACYRRWFQFFMGEYGSVEQIPMIKLSLNVLISRSAALRQIIPVSASWKSISLDFSFI